MRRRRSGGGDRGECRKPRIYCTPRYICERFINSPDFTSPGADGLDRLMIYQPYSKDIDTFEPIMSLIFYVLRLKFEI